MILTSVFCLFLSGVAAEKECWDSPNGGPTFTGNHNYPSGWFPEFQYDPNNPDEIDRNSSVEIRVIGGFPPYTWEVSGNGFSLSLDETEGLSNALIANSTACGTATITVKDKYGAPVTGYVRCTTGQWSSWSSNRRRVSVACGDNVIGDGPPSRVIISGKDKWVFGAFAGYYEQCSDNTCRTWSTPSTPTPAPPCGSPHDCWDGTCTNENYPNGFYDICDYYVWECAP